MPGFHAGRAPRNKGLRYPADPPKVEEKADLIRVRLGVHVSEHHDGIVLALEPCQDDPPIPGPARTASPGPMGPR
jgi:hypothetical protein